MSARFYVERTKGEPWRLGFELGHLKETNTLWWLGFHVGHVFYELNFYWGA